MNNTRAYKAKQLRYKKSALASLSYEIITDEIDAIETECDEIKYFMDDDYTLVDAMDGDEEEAYEFKMLFADLSCDCERLNGALNENYNLDADMFNNCTVALVGGKYRVIGFDSYEQDWYGLTGFEEVLAQTESGKRLMHLTKNQMISTWGQCLGIVMAYLDVRYKYDYLKASFDIIKERNRGILQTIKAIEEVYIEAEMEEFNIYEEATKRYDALLKAFPDYDRIWIE